MKNKKNAIYYFSGEASWPKLAEVDRFGKYSINVKLDAPSLEAFAMSGLKTKLKDGVLTLRRNPSRMVKGVNEDQGPPVVLDKDNKPFGDPRAIGNGSKVTCKVDVYFLEKMAMMGSRLEIVRVDELKTYDGGKPAANAPEGVPF